MKKPKVLMEDDRLLNIESRIPSNDHNVIKPPDGIDLLIRVEKTLPDLILLNTMVSNKSNCAVCREFKTNHKTKFIPILL